MADGVTVRIIGDKEMKRWLRDLGPQAEKIGRGVLYKVAHNVRNRVLKELRTAKPKKGHVYPAMDTGSLAKSYGVDMRARGDEQIAVIGSNAVYAHAVEFGREPGDMPPVSQLFGWVQRKVLGIRGLKGDKTETIEGVAYAIAESIERNGTDPHPHLVPAFNIEGKKLESEFAKAINRALK
jgi:HK97 gp10 family phage protein